MTFFNGIPPDTTASSSFERVRRHFDVGVFACENDCFV